MLYKDLEKGKVSENEAKVREYWQKIDLLKASIETRKDATPFIFYEGPPTANGMPGVHHVISRALKDSVLRYKTMKGFKVNRKAGWDTHGLPVEIEVEKRLGIKSKPEIEAYGIKEFNEQCRSSVFEYETQWKQMSQKMGYLIDLDNPYITLDNDYIETVWWILDKFHKEGMIYEGHKILPYCPRCGTGLASHEVAQGYKEINTTTVFVEFKRKDADEYFLVWTTTPWTLASNVALTVNPKEKYVKANHKGKTYIIEKNLASKVLDGEYTVVEEMLGKDLEYVEYEQLMPFVKTDKKAFYVTCADYVTVEDGTGIVHTAPSFGEDDYNTGLKYDLPVIQPVDLEGKYTTTPWEGKFVIDADPEIIEWLWQEGKLYRKQKMLHNYPHCWRCKTPLIYYAKESWFIEMTKLRDQLVENNSKVNWFPSHVGEKRFGNWLENIKDWAISRSRYWGTPLNLWKCSCGHIQSIGSREELRKLSITELPEHIEMHRPYVDDIKIPCEKCGKEMTRVTDVVDCWFDSGAMPFAQLHYPFENKDVFDANYPADFICEGIDQTRGWFNSLLAISTFVTGKSSYKNVLVNDLILDKHGKKMSKSVGNTVDAQQLLEEFGADAVRWYFYYSSPAWQPTKFDRDMLIDISSKFFGTLKNVYNFFTLYSNNDGVDARGIELPVSERTELDRWILSKLNKLIYQVTEDFDRYDHTKAVRKIQDFVIEDLSNWYIRRSRRRFWSVEADKSVYRTTYEVLLSVTKLIAPFAPFLSEEIYLNLTGKEESVHLAEYPSCDNTLLDEKTEERMDLVRNLVTLGRAVRESVKIKVRQPLALAIIDGKYESIISDLSSLIEEELNVKNVQFEYDLPKYMDFSLKPNFKVLGPVLGKNINVFSAELAKLDQGETAMKLESGESINISFADTSIEASSENVLISIKAKDGFAVKLENNVFIILNTDLDDSLLREGYARELVSRIQQTRKNMELDMMDRIVVNFESSSEFVEGIKEFEEFIKTETLADEIIYSAMDDCEELVCNGHNVRLKVTKNS